jgi:hypothetical protein
MRSGSRTAISLGLLFLVAEGAAAQQIYDVPLEVVGDPLAHYMQETPRDPADYEELDSPIYRVTRDYNRDGRLDVAFVFTDNCGAGAYSAGCPYEFYLQLADGRFRAVGGAWLRGGEGAAIESPEPGVAHLMPCEVNQAGEYWIASIRISEGGLRQEPSVPIVDFDADPRCSFQPDEQVDYTYERCSTREYLRTRTCVWRPAREE